MTNDRLEWLLVDNGGVAGFYLATLNHRHPNKAKWFREMLNRFEPTAPLMRQEQQMSTDFYLDKAITLEKFDGEQADFQRWAYRCFENWWHNKRRDNQKHYERAVFVATAWEDNPATKNQLTLDKGEENLMDKIRLKKIWRLLPLLDDRESALFEVFVGLRVIEYDENGDAINYPPKFIPSVNEWRTGKIDTIRKHKKALRLKIKNYIENYDGDMEEMILEELRITKMRDNQQGETEDEQTE